MQECVHGLEQATFVHPVPGRAQLSPAVLVLNERKATEQAEAQDQEETTMRAAAIMVLVTCANEVCTLPSRLKHVCPFPHATENWQVDKIVPVCVL